MLDPRQRAALAAAIQSGLADRARPVGCRTYQVPSRTQPGVSWLVTHTPDGRVWRCQCPAGQYGRPCVHAGAAYVAWARAQRRRAAHHDQRAA